MNAYMFLCLRPQSISLFPEPNKTKGSDLKSDVPNENSDPKSDALKGSSHSGRILTYLITRAWCMKVKDDDALQ